MAEKNSNKKNSDTPFYRQKSKKGKIIGNTAIVIILISVACWFVWSIFLSKSNSHNNIPLTSEDSARIEEKKNKYREEFIEAATTNEDTTEKTIYVSDPSNLNIKYDIDKTAGKSIRRIYNGRRINIAITGLDSRLGTRSNHADANHVLSFLIDSGIVEITSIPRDTYADAGYDDSTGQNKLTVLRAAKGRQEYLKELANIAGLDKIHYWAEAGFSQVMGLIDFLGFKDAKSTLQVLRSRTGLGGDDYQRCYNQGQFIRQMMLKNFKLFTGALSDVIIRGGLLLVETNLTSDVFKNLVSSYESKGFPMDPSKITIKVRPPLGMNFKLYDFTDEKLVQSLKNKIERFNASNEHDTAKKSVIDVAYKLNSLLQKASLDTAKKPANVITALSVYFEQRAWLQVSNINDRNRIRDEFGILLSTAYIKKKQPDKANRVKEIINSEKELFKHSVKSPG